jgi:hypothetical protein
MFSNSKQTSARQDIFLQELSEEQLTQVAGGNWSSSSDDNDKKYTHKHHHMHKHHQWHKTTRNHYGSDWNKKTTQYGSGHW